MATRWPNLVWGAPSVGDPPTPPNPDENPFVTYRLALAQRGTSSGLGTVIISDVHDGVGTEQRGRQLRFTEKLNDYGTLEFVLPIDHADVTRANYAVGNRELHLYRDDGAGERLVWGGKLWTADVTGSGWFVRFVGHGWWYDFTRRLVTADYAFTSRDQLRIVRDLVDNTQAEGSGGLGITHYDTSLSGVNRRIAICVEEGRIVADVIEELSQANNGFDFEVTPDKKLRLWYPKRGGSSGLTFDGTLSLSDFGYTEDALDIVTEIVGLGPQEECSVPETYTAASASAKATYGLLQEAEQLEENKDGDLRTAIVDERLRLGKQPLFEPKIGYSFPMPEAHGFFDYQVGDTAIIQTSRGNSGGFGYFTQTFRILAREVEVQSPGLEEITLTVDQVT